MDNTHMTKKNRWWNQSIGYVIYPSTFKDSNDDGIGDIPGIISKLDYLQELGVDLLWICPLFASPMDDNGYDVSDYRKINPLFGKDEDFARLLSEAHSRGIRIIVDFVLNHTSDEHPWFQKALKDPTSEERGLYFFRKGKRVGDKLLPPTNWKGFFSTGCWENVPGTDDFYLHIFSKKMPDVNWDNPKTRQRYYDIARYYLEMGVDGFRLDAVAHLAKDLSFEDSTKPVDENGWSFDMTKFSKRPALYDYLLEFKKEVLDHYDCLTVGEVGGGITAPESLKFSDYEKGSIDMVFNFDTAWCNGCYDALHKEDREIRTDVLELKRNFKKWHAICEGKSDMPFYWCNHDHPRALSQYGSIFYRKESGKMLAMILLFLYGTPFIYNGDEIGMSNVDYDRPEDFFDDVGNKNHTALLRKQGYKDETITRFLIRTSRINGRTPMQWDGSPLGGFSTRQYKNRMNRNHLKGVNVAEEEADPDSILNFYKKAIRLRKQKPLNDLVQKGSFELIDEPNPDVLSFAHHNEKGGIVLIANMRPYTMNFVYEGKAERLLLHNYEDMPERIAKIIKLRPFEAMLLEE